MCLDKNEHLLKSYNDIFQEKTKLDIFNNVTCFPHREVVKENRSTTKIRVVFDASIKGQDNPSLNDGKARQVLLLRNGVHIMKHFIN